MVSADGKVNAALHTVAIRYCLHARAGNDFLFVELIGGCRGRETMVADHTPVALALLFGTLFIALFTLNALAYP